jgi:uncharacterized LabA/DUF88 family protein
MDLKARIFIDGSWLYHCSKNINRINKFEYYKINYNKLILLIKLYLNILSDNDIDVIKTHYFGAIPINLPGKDPSDQRKFYWTLKNKCKIDTEIYEINFRNNPNAKPNEKCVDAAIITSMMYHSFSNESYDIGILLTGDLDFYPLIHKLQLCGKKILLVAIDKIADIHPTSNILIDRYDFYDFPPLFLNDFYTDISLNKKKYKRRCNHCGSKSDKYFRESLYVCEFCKDHGYKTTSKLCKYCGTNPVLEWMVDCKFCNDCSDLMKKIYETLESRIDENEKKNELKYDNHLLFNRMTQP